MRKVLAIVWWAWIPFCGQPLRGQAPGVGIQPSQDQKQQAELSTKQPQSDQRGTQDSPLVIDLKQRQKTKAEAAEDKRKDDAKEYRDTWTFRLTVLNTIISALLFIIGAGGVYAAVHTLNMIERQATLMERQTEAMMNAERAHIDTELIQGEGGSYGLSISNNGKSPAYLDFYSFTHHWFDAGKSLPDNFREIEYSQSKAIINRMLGPGQNIKPPFNADIAQRLNEDERTGRKQAIFRGSVTYDDIFTFGKVQRENRHQTELVYRYDLQSERLVNMPQYNIYT